jgi:CRISPR-associated protein Cas5d
MSYGIKIMVSGKNACFTRPEFKVERVSYDVITPSAARGIIEAIYWKPAIKWIIDKIHVINPVKFDSVRRNERLGIVVSPDKVKKVMNGAQIRSDHTQRTSLILCDVCYVIEAHFELTEKATIEDTAEKHYNIAIRRMCNGQCFSRPYLGCREFAADFEFIKDKIPESHYSGEKDLGFMLYDIDFVNDAKATFFRALMVNGIIDVNTCLQCGCVA